MKIQDLKKVLDQIKLLSKGWLISLGGGLVALVGLLLPWVMTKLPEAGNKLGGKLLADVSKAASKASNLSGLLLFVFNKATVIPFLISFLALAVVAVFMVLYLRRQKLDKLSSIVVMACGAVSLVFSIIVFIIVSSQIKDPNIKILPQSGLFITLLGYIAVAAGGFVNFKEFSRLPPAAPAASRLPAE